MAEEPNENENAEDNEGGEAKKGPGKFKLIGMALGGVVGGLVIGGALAFFMGWLDGPLGIEREKTTATLTLGTPVYHELPQITVDLKTGLCRSPFLRATVNVQLDDTYMKELEKNQGKVMDAILAHLRDQERQDVVGKEGTEKLRFELVNVINAQITPARIHTILFKEFVVQ